MRKKKWSTTLVEFPKHTGKTNQFRWHCFSSPDSFWNHWLQLMDWYAVEQIKKNISFTLILVCWLQFRKVYPLWDYAFEKIRFFFLIAHVARSISRTLVFPAFVETLFIHTKTMNNCPHLSSGGKYPNNRSHTLTQFHIICPSRYL